MSEEIDLAIAAEYRLFQMANEKGKFALDQDHRLIPRELQEALERGFDNDWWQLIDVAIILHSAGRPVRVFKLLPAGKARFEWLKWVKSELDRVADQIEGGRTAKAKKTRKPRGD
jgi:hypothetical protein